MIGLPICPLEGSVGSVFLWRLDILGGAGACLRGAAILPLDRIVHLLSVDGDRLRGLDAEADFITPDINDGHHDIVANHDALVSVAGKDQHVVLVW